MSIYPMRNHIPQFFYLVAFFFLSIQTSYSSEKNYLIMGYKEGSKPPYIGELGDNNGAYKDLFSQAANMIGYQLKIIRLPKKRIYQQLSKGEIDFYPSSGFSKQREAYLYWFANGFLTKPALLSTAIDKEITDIRQTKGTILAPLGSSVSRYATNNPQLRIQNMGVLPIDKAILALQLGRGDFYIYDLDTLDYYLKRKQLTSFNQLSLRLHTNAIKNEYSSLQTAFSIYSKHFTAVSNPNYDQKISSSFLNQKQLPSKDSVAYLFEKALTHLKETGETHKIYNKYFK